MTATKERNVYEKISKEGVFKKLVEIFGEKYVTNKS